jgi:Transglycosylase SLT domain
MANRFLPGALSLAIAILSLNLVPPIEAKNRDNLELAAAFQLPELPKLPGLGGGSADWRQWDSFFTFIVKRVGQDVSGDLRDSLGEAFLDSRYELTATVARLGGGQNPVPQLFLNGWRRLSPVMNKALPALPQQSAERYRNFIGAIDKVALVGPQSSRLGLLQISPDILRSMARILQPSGSGDPIAYNLNVDGALRNLIGFGAPIGARSPRSKQSGLRGLPFPLNVERASLGSAHAADADIKKLNQWVPEEKELQSYLLEVRNLLAALGDRVGVKSELAEQHKALYRQIVFTAAWQESCWRQFIKKGKTVIPLASASGDLGLMQVNRNTWRNLYDLKRLGGDIEYNGNAGGEILAYYLSRYAIRKNEDKQQGGNLARATYAAYNGGPSHLARYRAAKQDPELKKVDEAFWDKFQAVSSGRELEVQRCYQKQS